jgi:hypothetical protein
MQVLLQQQQRLQGSSQLPSCGKQRRRRWGML